jgi:predicted transcriptional regulator
MANTKSNKENAGAKQYEVVWSGAGQWVQGDIISAEDAGDNLKRWRDLGAIRVYVAPQVEEDEEGDEQPPA